MAIPYAQYLGGVFSSTKLSVSGMKKPEAAPPRNCSASSQLKVVAEGVINEITAKEIEAAISTRRGPKMAPNPTAAKVTDICATVCAVVIHAPSSKPAPTAPRMSASPKVDSRAFRVDMNVPISTATSPSHG